MNGTWTEENFVVQKSSRGIGTGDQGSTIMVSYDSNHNRRDLCDWTQEDGTVCRRKMGHDGLCIPFSGELVAISGVVVEHVTWSDA